ncbi:MAG: lipocalin-like domain-containing protein [Candidatus Lernaella stagnicola]|nr:lipocalin-like domain-containing protein [Candidatus Lernaella stagnicola]
MGKLKYFLPFILVPLAAVIALFAWKYFSDRVEGSVEARSYFASPGAGFVGAPVPSGAEPLSRHAFDFSETNFEFPQEWWYFNAHLLDERNRRYGLMIAMLKTGQLLGSFTLVHHELHFPFQTTGLVELNPRLRAVTAPMSMLLQPYADRFEYEFRFKHKVAQVTLRLHANKYPLPVGGTGNIAMGKAGRSYYFSLTNMDVSGRGRIRGTEVSLTGKGWMDHQWGEWEDREFDKWYWYSIQLADNTEIMIFEFLKLSQVVAPICDIVYPDGTVKHGLKYEIEPMKTWVSPKTGRSWRLGWNVRIPEVGADLEMVPDLINQEVTKSLWEGVCHVDGTFAGKPTRGLAFYEARQRTW